MSAWDGAAEGILAVSGLPAAKNRADFRLPLLKSLFSAGEQFCGHSVVCADPALPAQLCQYPSAWFHEQRARAALMEGQHLVTAWIAAYPQRCFCCTLLCNYLPHVVSSPAAFTAVFKRVDKEQWTDGHLRRVLVVGRGVVLALVLACSILSRQIPLWFLMKFPFSWLAHCKTLFTPSFVWKEWHPHRWLLFSCHSHWDFLCSFLYYPQVKSRLAKKTYPRFRKNLNSKNILLLLSKLGMQWAISYFISSKGIVLLFIFGWVSK